MSQTVPRDRPLSDDDRAYLHSRGEHSLVELLDQQFPPGEAGEAEPEDDYDEWKVAELQEELKSRQLDTSGKKDELIARLRESDAAPQS